MKSGNKKLKTLVRYSFVTILTILGGKEFTISIKYTKSLDAKDLSQQTLHLFGIIYRKVIPFIFCEIN